ncbi:hypothetical protein P43SY_006302 [Pythium insidiosum]|uniref:PROP1-like PPR domain-containing protein n=1 Tax=Pythium insidiosum TaxID=114742 RepID=A0AAD5MDF3_PYTIN|nr:hypothetical protein P43SY_006302 [Pythium insidiosum]
MAATRAACSIAGRLHVRAASRRVASARSMMRAPLSPVDRRFFAAHNSGPQSRQRHRREPSTRPSGDYVVAQIQELLTKSTAQAGFEPDFEFLRAVASALLLAKTPSQLQAAGPLCKLVERAPTLHGGALIECVRIYEASGRPRDAVEVARRLLQQDFFLMNPVLASAVHACATLRDVASGFELLELARARGSIPNRNVFGAMLALCAATGESPPTSPRVRRLLAIMAECDVAMNHATFHHWMTSYAKAGYYDVVEQLGERMDEYALEPNDVTYAILMDASAERGDYDKTLARLEELKHRAQQPADSAPLELKLVHYNVALKACGKASQLPRAFELYEEMKREKIAPDLVTYITMMHAVFHGDLGHVDKSKVKAAMAGVGALALAAVPAMDLQEHWLTALFCGSLVGSMGLAVYMNPDGALRTLYPNSDEPHDESVIEAFFRRLREEDHCGRCMYLWREMLQHKITPDARIYDILVRTCVKKRHPELALEAVMIPQAASASASVARPPGRVASPTSGVGSLVDIRGQFVLSLPTTVALLHSLLVQRRVAMADTLFDAARAHQAFRAIFREHGSTTGARDTVYTYDLRAFSTVQTRSYAMRRVLTTLHGERQLFGVGDVPRLEFLVLHGFDLLDQLDREDPQLRALFAMDEMTREAAAPTDNAQFFFRLTVPRERLAEYFGAPLAQSTAVRL